MYRLRLIFTDNIKKQLYSDDVEFLCNTLIVFMFQAKINDCHFLAGWIDFLRGTSISENKEMYITKKHQYYPVCSICNHESIFDNELNLLLWLQQDINNRTITNSLYNEKLNINYDNN